jgi:hypothetical protein
MPVAFQELLQQIYSRAENGASLCLAYLEALLFPEKFNGAFHGAPIGAMPLFMFFNVFGNPKSALASLQDHIGMRIGNPMHPFSLDENYKAFLFDLRLNADLNKTSVLVVQRLGAEAAQPNVEDASVALNPNRETLMEFGQTEDHQRVHELNHVTKETGGWTYFATGTTS